MNKIWKRIGDAFFIVAGVALILPLFTDLPFRWELTWTFLAPAVIIQRLREVNEKGRKVEPILTIGMSLLLFGISFYSLLFNKM
ncbi:hypothetical protein ACJA3J_12005 [Halobacillus sp. SY10]|uniref:hypothetical protein n=1 Tax=Halobacillus sp. SY10 TaxID=3381356 RepID=UPI003879C560